MLFDLASVLASETLRDEVALIVETMVGTPEALRDIASKFNTFDRRDFRAHTIISTTMDSRASPVTAKTENEQISKVLRKVL